MSLLNAKQAMEYLNIRKADNFRKLVANGEIGYKIIGKSKFFPTEELDRWQNVLTYTNSTKEVKRGGHTSLSRPKTETIGLDALLVQMKNGTLSFSAPKKLKATQ